MKQNDDYELEPCPFCGGDLLRIVVPSEYGTPSHYWVRCVKCVADGPMADNILDAVTKWNLRPGRVEK